MRIRTMALLPLALIALALAAPFAGREAASAQDGAQTAARGRTGPSSALELNGKPYDLRSAEGGLMVGKVELRNGVKTVVGSMCEPMVLTLQMDSVTAVMESFSKGEALNGAVITFDAEGKAIRRHEFSNAAILEIAFKPFDASSKDLMTYTVKLDPASSAIKAGKEAQGKPAPNDSRSKASLAGSFRVSLDGRSVPRASTIDSISFRRARSPSGAVARGERGIDAANVRMKVSASDREAFDAWYRETVLENRGNPKTLRVDALSPNLRDVLVSLEAPAASIVALREPSGEQLSRIEVEMCVSAWILVKNP